MNPESAVIRDMVIAKACSGIIVRAEQQTDVHVLEQTFVDTGILPQVMNPNSQILYGRKGTGKSHLLRVLGATVSRADGSLSVYLDLRTLGSTDLITDQSRSLSIRCISLYRDLLSAIQYQLLDAATEPGRGTSGAGFEEVSRLADVLRRFAGTVTEREVTSELNSGKSQGSRIGFSLSSHGIGADLSASDGSSSSAKIKNRYTEAIEDTLVFAEVAEALSRAISAMGVHRLWILLDEWSAISPDAQPYIADFVKRTLLPVPQITVKIAALEYRSIFSRVTSQNHRVGFELGVDVQAGIDLDDYYLYDRSPDLVAGAFAELLYRHVNAESPIDYLFEKYGIKTNQALIPAMFADNFAFRELVRSGEGVVRDFLGIFTSCFFYALRHGIPTIDVDSIRESARNWFETDKAPNLDRDQARVLRNIVSTVVGEERSRFFLLEQPASSHEQIQALYELRVLHLIYRGVSNPDKPGGRYDMFALDYGTYSDLLGLNDTGLGIDSPGIALGPHLTAGRGSVQRMVLDPAILNAGDDEHG